MAANWFLINMSKSYIEIVATCWGNGTRNAICDGIIIVCMIVVNRWQSFLCIALTCMTWNEFGANWMDFHFTTEISMIILSEQSKLLKSHTKFSEKPKLYKKKKRYKFSEFALSSFTHFSSSSFLLNRKKITKQKKNPKKKKHIITKCLKKNSTSFLVQKRLFVHKKRT